MLRVLHEDEHLIAVDKPAACFVHPPEDSVTPVPLAATCLGMLKRQTGRYLYPIHRLDFATSGVLLFAFDAATAQAMNALFRTRAIAKSYCCVVRGWAPDEGVIERPLGAGEAAAVPAETRFETLARLELPHAVGKYSTARYSLVRVNPVTGRWHQIRRHLAGISHPIVGDVGHGDRHHNRFFREHLGLGSLLLRAHLLRFDHPMTAQPLWIESGWNDPWLRLFDLFGCCPLG